MPEYEPAIALPEVEMTEWIDFRGLIDNIVMKKSNQTILMGSF